MHSGCSRTSVFFKCSSKSFLLRICSARSLSKRESISCTVSHFLTPRRVALCRSFTLCRKELFFQSPSHEAQASYSTEFRLLSWKGNKKKGFEQRFEASFCL